MKKLLFLFPIFLLANCTCKNCDKSVKADTGFFYVQSIDKVQNDLTKVLCEYKISSDTLNATQRCDVSEHSDNPTVFYLIDTTGKYKVGDTLGLVKKETSISINFSY